MSKNENVTLGVCFTKRDRRRSWRVSFRAHLTCRLARVQLTVASPVRKALTHLPSFSNASLQSFRLAERWLGGVGRVVRKAKKEEDPAATIEAGLDIYLFFSLHIQLGSTPLPEKRPTCLHTQSKQTKSLLGFNGDLWLDMQTNPNWVCTCTCTCV